LGVAPSDQIHDDVIDSALSTLSDLSLVERISVSADTPKEAIEAATQTTDKPTSPTLAAESVDDGQQQAVLRSALDALQMKRILFESGSNVLTAQSEQTVKAMSEVFAQFPEINIEIEGHTDSSGASSNNLRLSQLRANAVRDYIIQQGIAAERLIAYGFGDGVPIADNGTAAGRKLNRRIEFNF